MHVVNHKISEPTNESRNVLIEAARIARGKIEPLDKAWLDNCDAVIFPGGFGADKNYCDFAVKGEGCSIHPLVEVFMREAVAQKKPLGVVCISPVVLARALKGTNFHPQITVGQSSGASQAVDNFGSKHIICAVTDCVVDKALKIVSTPAFMYDARISEVAQGIDKLVAQIAALIDAERTLAVV